MTKGIKGSSPPCLFEGCPQPSHARGYCKLHYKRLRRRGDPSIVLQVVGATPEQRFWPKVNKTETCWLWTGALGRAGYGHFYTDGRITQAHRFAYELLVGPIPDGLEPDHLCRNPTCVRPDHLEPVTRQTNVRRGRVAEAARIRTRQITHCPRGHPYDAANTYTDGKGTRHCRACHRERERQRYRKAAGES